MALTEAERERYGQVAQAANRTSGVDWADLTAEMQARHQRAAAAVVAAYQADLAATVTQWRDGARATWQAPDADQYTVVYHNAAEEALADVLILLDGGDDGNG